MSWFSTLFSARTPEATARRWRRRAESAVPEPVAPAPRPRSDQAAPTLSPPAARAVATETMRRPALNPWRLVFGAILIAFGIVALVYFAFQLRSVITLGLVSLLLAVGLQGPVAWLHRLGVPRPLGLLLLYVVAITALVLAFWVLLPPVFRDARELAERAPEYLASTEQQLDRLGLDVEVPGIAEVEQRIMAEVSGDVGSYLGRVVSILGFVLSLFGGVLNAFFVLILSVFIVMEGPTFRAHLLSLLPPDKARDWTEITHKIAVKIQGWLLGTLFLGLVIGGITTVALLLFGMPYPFLLGFVAGLGELIPMIGPIIAAVPAVGIAAFYGWGLFATVLVFYIMIQQLENYVLVPRIMGSTIDLPGLAVLVAFLIGSELLGITGGILAMPVAAVIQVLWLDWIVPAIRRGRPARPVDLQVSVKART